jgi:hypothetical protein
LYEFEDNHNTLIPGVVTPMLQVSWSRHRAWHGETITVLVRTELVKNGTKVKLEIHVKDGKSLDTLDKGTIADNRLGMIYKIDWKSKKLLADVREILVTATIKDLDLTAESDPLLVDLVPPLFSA